MTGKILNTRYKKVRLMYQDEAGFGRINEPKRCWAPKGVRPCVPCHHIREYRYAYGAVEPRTGDSFFLVLPYANTACINLFLAELSNAFRHEGAGQTDVASKNWLCHVREQVRQPPSHSRCSIYAGCSAVCQRVRVTREIE